jgi:GntR family transcriptional regulator of arabinose operon
MAKYQEIADELKQKIIQQEYDLNTAIPSELKLQEIYSVSRHTIRQAIAVLVNEGYLRKEKGSGTYVDNRYQSKNEPVNKTKTIGVITTYISDYIFPTIIRGIENELRKSDYSLLLVSTNNDHQLEKECLEKMINYGVDGLIVEPTKSNQYNPNLALYVSLREQGIPMVMINAAYEELDASFIGLDDVKVGFMATEYLIKNGHKNLLFITKIDDLQGKYRMKGFISACEQYNVSFLTENIITFTTENREEIVGRVLSRLKEEPDLSGIICYNDQIASLLFGQLNKNGYKIPEDISMIGADDSSLSYLQSEGLTTLAHPKEKLGRDAANWMIKTIEEGKEQPNIVYEPVLIERETVAKKENHT